jgi:hypothetical protein
VVHSGTLNVTCTSDTRAIYADNDFTFNDGTLYIDAIGFTSGIQTWRGTLYIHGGTITIPQSRDALLPDSLVITGGTVNVTGTHWNAISVAKDAHITGGVITAIAATTTGYGNDAIYSWGGNITIGGNAHVTATGGNNGAGIRASGIIDIGGNAIVNATGGNNGAGIGGIFNISSATDGGTITIGGNATVTAVGGSRAAGIGGGGNDGGTIPGGNGGTITINGGTVTATGDWSSAGIGGGWQGNGGTITIGGNANVTATGDWGSAGIGGGAGFDGDAGTINISGTPVINATHGANPGSVAWGIGPGDTGTADNITVTGGTFTGGAIRISTTNYWAVIFDLAGGTYSGSTNNAFRLVADNTAAALSTEPTRAGYTFGGWGTNADPVTGHMTVTAQWQS